MGNNLNPALRKHHVAKFWNEGDDVATSKLIISAALIAIVSPPPPSTAIIVIMILKRFYNDANKRLKVHIRVLELESRLQVANIVV